MKSLRAIINADLPEICKNSSVTPLHNFTVNDTQMCLQRTLMCEWSQTNFTFKLRSNAAFESLMLPQISFVLITTSAGLAYEFFLIHVIASTTCYFLITSIQKHRFLVSQQIP